MHNQTYYLFTKQTTSTTSLKMDHFFLRSYIYFAVLFCYRYLVKQNCSAIQYLF